ncbi:MAG: apolipoprotein N-acyltransferase [Candidatus Omnitrophica bacterium]|nr:apolipoprotein N-acyltransferase [Candidatus Omnitrophota bacterium]
MNLVLAGPAKSTKNAAVHKMVFLSCLLSAGLLILSFPRIEWALLAWVSLVPLFHVLDGQAPWRAFRRAYLCGFLFFFGTLGWFVYVTYPGAILLITFLSLYFAVFGVMFVYFQKLPITPRIFVLASSWVALEYIRAHLFSGFGWVMLGHSQYQNLLFIQMADITGVYGVSFVVILVNLLFFETLRAILKKDDRARRSLFSAQIAVIAILLGVLIYGLLIASQKKQYRAVNIGVVQPNIPLEVNWDQERKPWIVNQALQLTEQLGASKLDLIVWPETSLPGIISDAPLLVKKIQLTALRLRVPILIGSVAHENGHYYNSAFLIGADGQIQGRYDKIHLVPFGEYLPLRPILGWINNFVELDDFTSGQTYKIFSAAGGKKKFGVLICFEDTLGYLRRNFTQEGAEFFVNMTNDAWFKDTKAPFLQLQAAVFGCVENRRALVRAANTGVSAWVDTYGRILHFVHDGHGKKTFIAASSWGRLPLGQGKTFYTKYGDAFTYLCFLCILVAVGVRRMFH